MTVQSMGRQPDPNAVYREMQRAIPGLDGMYRLVSALIASHVTAGNRVLFAGAGGGREIEALGADDQVIDITAVDPSGERLNTAKQVAEWLGTSDRITFFEGTVGDLPSGPNFDVATSLLVMHHLRDDGTKLDYLSALQGRLAPGGALIHADVCHNGAEEFESLIPVYLAHASHVAVADDIARIETNAVSRLPIVSPERTRALFDEAGFTPPREVFRSLWYRCWICTRASP